MKRLSLLDIYRVLRESCFLHFQGTEGITKSQKVDSSERLKRILRHDIQGNHNVASPLILSLHIISVFLLLNSTHNAKTNSLHLVLP